MNNLGIRLRTARKEKGLTQPALAKEIGVTKSAISQWETGTTKSMDSSKLLALASILDVSPNWLSDGKGEKHTIGIATIKDASRGMTVMQSNVTEGPDITGRVPLISWVQAGSWAEIIDNHHPGDAEDWLLTTAKVSNQAFALRVQGDSMTAPHGTSIPEGSIVIVDPNQHCNNGNIVVARLEDSMEATLKKLVIDGNQKFLKPLNPAYPVIPINGNCQIIGKAVRVEFEL